MAMDIHELVRRAFWAARDKGKPDWWKMTTAVLKNRLLTLTDRQFKEEDYDARTIVEFGLRYPHLLSVDTTTFPPEVELRPTRIRDDLWRAVVDYSSGKEYVWDEAQQKARVRTASDKRGLVLPTLTRQELTRWREEFAQRQRASLDPREGSALTRWVRDGLQTRALPARLQIPWNHEQAWRVWDRLSRWFGESLPSREPPSIFASVRTTREPQVEPVPTAITDSASGRDDEELARCRDTGDWLALGELVSSRFGGRSGLDLEKLFAQVTIAWAQPIQHIQVAGIADIIAHLDELTPQHAATALINASYRVRKARLEIPSAVSDVAFRLSEAIAATYGVTSHRGPMQLCVSATAVLASARDRLATAVAAFLKTNAVTAKIASIDVIRAVREYRPFSLSAEHAYLRELEIVLGPSFRKFCESCERHSGAEAVRRAEELRAQTARLLPEPGDARLYSKLWTEVVQPVVKHIGDLLEEGTRQSEEFDRPQLTLLKGPQKLDLASVHRPTTVSCRLLNTGHGRALRIDVEPRVQGLPVELDLLEPKRPFDVAGNAGQVVTFSVVIREAVDVLRVPVTWVCSDASERRLEFSDELEFKQQGRQPDWDALLMHPPYTINPVKKKEALFGRDAMLKRLLLHAASGTSTFVWGQKRVGKTSVLQVLDAELSATPEFVCVFLRMGELVALHEGQIAHTIAVRINEKCGTPIVTPGEEYFGAGLNRLIPVITQLVAKSRARFVVIIDEFDDLDAAFYTGERGRQFVKALRSLSEVGLTFFFVGSERMDAIYRRHDVELNKWVNASLDRIESIADCKALIVEPVKGAIEYEDAAIDLIVQYCGGNPFYMHLFCFEAFKRCVEEHRTFVSNVDVQLVRQHLLRTLGRTNFAHFWEDNPELGPEEQASQTAQNCLAFALIASLGGRYEDADEVFDAQDSLDLGTAELMTRTDLGRTLERLRGRRILVLNHRTSQVEISLPIFRDWLAENADDLVPTWREFLRRSSETEHVVARTPVIESAVVHFPIAEDELLAVSQRLVYCGKQKDVAEVRQWLKQFDDDSRIEVAFLLLRRLAERGYMSEGARGRTLTLLEEALQARRVQLGSKTWKIARGRRDNLCVTFVDSETKSGASTAREMAKRLRPGKVAGGSSIEGWLSTHRDDDPLVLIVDDFSGTGATLEEGIQGLLSSISRDVRQSYLAEGRLSCYCQFAFPEALDRLRAKFPKIEFHAAHIFDDDVRALDPQAVFDSDEDRLYARDILLQIGRQLTPQNPLGWGDMAVLVAFHNTIPNNSLPIFWSSGKVNDRQWIPLFPRA